MAEVKNNKERANTIEKCLLSLAEGDLSALNELYPLIKTDLFAFALSKVENKFDAEDIMHDTFVHIYKNAKLYTPQGKPMAWIITLESNIIKRFFQLKARNIRFADLNLEPQDSSFDAQNYQIDDSFIKEIFKGLKEEEKEIIALHIVSDLKFREIAEILNKPISSIITKYNRAIKKIQKYIKEEKL